MPETRQPNVHALTIDDVPIRPGARIASAETMRRHAMRAYSMADYGWMASFANSWGPIQIDHPAEVIPEDGYPMETIKHTSFYGIGSWQLDRRHVMLFMGGSWVKGGWNTQTSPQCFCSIDPAANTPRAIEWDRANQPTRWKPLPR